MPLRFKSLIFALVLLSLAGCYRQAGDSIEPLTNPTSVPAAQTENNTIQNAPVEEALTDFPATPTLPPITVIQPATSAVETSAPLSPPATPTEFVEPTVPSQELILPSPTLEFITPNVPMGPISIDTPTPSSLIPATATPSGLITPTALFDTSSLPCTYTVKPGDNLYRIAVNNNTSLEELRAANPEVRGDLIQPGQVLKIPGCAPGVDTSGQTTTDTTTIDTSGSTDGQQRIHTVKAGETLLAIARQYGVTVADIVRANNLSNPDRLSVGQQLIIP